MSAVKVLQDDHYNIQKMASQNEQKHYHRFVGATISNILCVKPHLFNEITKEEDYNTMVHNLFRPIQIAHH